MSAFTNEIIGQVSVDNFPATQPVSATDLDIRDLNSATDSVTAIGPLTDTQLRATPVPVSFSSASLTPTVSRVSVGSGAAVQLTAANFQRAVIHNESGTLYVKLGTGASATDYSYRLTANQLLEINFSANTAITAIKATGTSDVQVTRLA